MILREQKPIEVCGKKFFIHKMQFKDAREIGLQYLPTFLGRSKENYVRNEDLFFKLISHVTVPHESLGQLPLNTWDLINSHFESFLMGELVEKEIYCYNFDFLVDGSLSKFLEGIRQKLPSSSTKILKVFSQFFFPKN